MQKIVQHGCDDVWGHRSEERALRFALSLGQAESAGLMPECAECGHLSGYWKSMRCGCTFVAMVVGVEAAS